MKAYKPLKRNIIILNRAMEHIKSVDYKVSVRWVFYRLYDEGFYKKGDYNTFITLQSKARHRYWNGWTPSILTDETRSVITCNGGYETIEEIVKNMEFRSLQDHMYKQDYYIEVWYEARAMTAQFRTYTDRVNLRPMAGQPSIDYKWESAKALERAYYKYNKDVIVLYFGDCDKAGKTIYNAIYEDVTSWCDVPIQIIHCGLSISQAMDLNLPEKPDKPGVYQWESLTDPQANKIITQSIGQYIKRNLIIEASNQEDIIDLAVNKHIEEFKQKILYSLE